MKSFRIGKRDIGAGCPTLVVAEIGVNHDGSAARALELVAKAKQAGADAVKLQVFRAEELMHASCRFADYQKSRVDDADPIAMLKRYELSIADLLRIVDAIVNAGMIPVATAFSLTDMPTLRKLKVAAVKVASPDLINQPLLEAAAKLNRPMLLSTGAATGAEVRRTADLLGSSGAEFVLMHCVSSYPTPAEDARLCWLDELKRFGAPVGYSDHTTDPLAGALASGMGACVVEKHLTYDRRAPGPDHSASADPAQFREYVDLIRRADALRGCGVKCVLPVELDVRRVSRQSLVAAKDIRAGAVIQSSDLKTQRPGTGISAADVVAVAGRVALSAIAKGTMLRWNHVQPARSGSMKGAATNVKPAKSVSGKRHGA